MEQPKIPAKSSWIEKWIEEAKKLYDQPVISPIVNSNGKIGYLFAWLLGVPVWILLIVFVIRG